EFTIPVNLPLWLSPGTYSLHFTPSLAYNFTYVMSQEVNITICPFYFLSFSGRLEDFDIGPVIVGNIDFKANIAKVAIKLNAEIYSGSRAAGTVYDNVTLSSGVNRIEMPISYQNVSSVKLSAYIPNGPAGSYAWSWNLNSSGGPPSRVLLIDETGLPEGTIWGVSVGNITYYTNSSLSIQLPVGRISVDPVQISGYISRPISINLTENTSLAITYVPVEFSVVVSNSGIVNGSKWGISIGNISLYSDGDRIALSLRPGEYILSIHDPMGFIPNQSALLINLTSNSSISIHSSKYFSPEELMSSISPVILISIAIPVMGYIFRRKQRHTIGYCETCRSPFRGRRSKHIADNHGNEGKKM
ncbi:MAG: hypothetical protein QXV22_03640, partial [Thermoplasmataceae archaeon]